MSISRRRAAKRGRAAVFTAAVVLSAAAAAVAAASVSTGTYSGTTSEKQPVSFKITNHGKTVRNFKTTLGYDGQCGSGGGPVYKANAGSISIGAGGKFSKKITLRLNAQVHAPGRIKGTASGKTVTGEVFQYLPSGKRNKCYTESFTASKI